MESLKLLNTAFSSKNLGIIEVSELCKGQVQKGKREKNHTLVKTFRILITFWTKLSKGLSLLKLSLTAN